MTPPRTQETLKKDEGMGDNIRGSFYIFIQKRTTVKQWTGLLRCQSHSTVGVCVAGGPCWSAVVAGLFWVLETISQTSRQRRPPRVAFQD